MSSASAAAKAVRQDAALIKAVADFCLEGWAPPKPALRAGLGASERWQALAGTGTALWLDSGDVEAVRKLWTREFSALTTNNTLLNKEVQKGIYDGLVPRAAKLLRKVDPEIGKAGLVQEIAFILNAVHGLKLVSTFDADVSVELHTSVARDVESSAHYGKRFHAICPERFIVKVPLTPEGILAARRLSQEKIRVNFTLGFSARQNQIIAAIAQPAFVNVFMGRLNAFVADRGLGDGRNFGEKATLASQRLLRQLGKRSGAQVRQIGASMRSGEQCAALAGLDVHTIPTSAAEEFLKLPLKPSEMRDRSGEDPEVALKPGFDLKRERLDVFWAASPELEKALKALDRVDLDVLSPQALVAFLKKHGLGDLFPELSPEDRSALGKDGKIPQFERWRPRVQIGALGWDALFTEAALASFAADQRQLDDRIARFL